MSSLFRILKQLEYHKVSFYIQRTRPDAICLTATFVGLRVEIYVFEDEHVEVSRFTGNEDIEGGEEIIGKLLKSND